MRNETTRGQLDLLVLSVLADEPRHGYGVVSELRRRSGGELEMAEGTLYPALHRLEGAGLLASEWDESAPRRRRVYRLTRDGHGGARRAPSRVDSFAAAVHKVVSA